MKKLLSILIFIPLTLFGQENDPCYSINDYNLLTELNNPQIEINLVSGWNMIGYPCTQEVIVSDAFSSIVNEITIVKDNNGNVYLPEFSFNGIGFLEGGQGYQIKMTDFIHGFTFCQSIQFPTIEGCTDCEAVNFSELATTDDGSCSYDSDGDGIPDSEEVVGCQDLTACDYDINATDSGDCTYALEGYDCEGNFVCYYPEDLSFLHWLEDYYPSVLSGSNCIDLESASSYSGPIIVGPDSTIQNIDGIQYFNNTSYLEINGLSQLIEIPDISGLINLDTLAIGNNYVLTSLSDLSNLTNLSTIGIGYNYSLESLPDLSELSHLTFLDINDNYSLTTLPDLSGLTSLDTLLIYNNNSLGCALAYPEHLTIQIEWPPVCEQELTYQVGDLAEGGIVFYVDETGEHGLVSALEDLTEGTTINSEGNPGYQWGCFATGISGADGQAIGTGYQNTLDIASGCSETPIAASQALAYESEGYSDWYLPSLDELNEMYNAIGTGGSEGNIGGFISNWHWSSSESNNYGAYDVNFGDGSTGNFSSKTKIVRVRVIRSF